jgi:hypothetical protein
MTQGLHHKRSRTTIIFQTETPTVSFVTCNVGSAEGICVADHHQVHPVSWTASEGPNH